MSHVPFLKARFGGLFSWCKQFCATQFWGGHPNTFRGLFAWASLSIAVYLILESEAFSAHGYELMRLVASHQTWALLFFVHWLCVSAVVLSGPAKRIGVWVQLLVNGYGMFIWSMYVVLQDMAFGHFAINASAERVLVLYSVWAFVRTGMYRSSDRNK